jgi:hypothetical protein
LKDQEQLEETWKLFEEIAKEIMPVTLDFTVYTRFVQNC